MPKLNKFLPRRGYTPRSVVRFFMLAMILTSVMVGMFSYTRGGTPERVYAATSSNLNYQARLLSSNGNIVPDGYYNIEFKLYSSATSGAALWTERYSDTNGATAGNDTRVRVVNGYLSVNLGTNTAFPTNINWDQDMWLTMNIGGPAQTASPVFDGEMSPRIKLTAVPYAFQAKQATRLQQTQGLYTGTLDFGSLTANRSIALPDADGTICLQGSSSCGFGSATGNGNYIQNGTALQTANFSIQSSDTGSVSAAIRSITGQTADIFQVNNSTGGRILSVASDGNVSVGGASVGGRLGVATESTGARGLVVKGVTGQVADLVQLVSSSGTVLSSFSATGQLKVASAVAYNGALNVGTDTATAAGGIYFGSDTNLYRAAASTLKTDSSLVVGAAGGTSTLTVNGSLGSVSTSTSGNNLNFSRAGVNYITATAAGSELRLGAGGNASNLVIGSSGQAILQNTVNGSSGFVVRSAGGNSNTNPGNTILNINTLTSAANFGQYQNLLQRSEAFDNAIWVKGSSAAVQPDVISAPDSTLTADRLSFTSTATNNWVMQTYTPGSAIGTRTYTTSFWAKAGTISSAQIEIRGAPTIVDSTITNISLTNTWQRYSITKTFSAGTTEPSVLVSFKNSISSGVGDYYVWGAQLEESAIMGPYVSTSAAGIGANSQGLSIGLGNVNVRAAADSANAFQIQSAAGNSTFNVNTLTNTVSIGGNLTVQGSGTFNGIINTGATVNVAAIISDRNVGGPLGSADSTVDLYTTFNINQTTPNQTLSLPNPTDTTAGRVIYINNIGTVAFTMYGKTVGAGNGLITLVWNGTAWGVTDSTVNTGSGVNAIGVIDSQTKSPNGAVISGTTLYLQTADASSIGLVSAGSQTFGGDKTFNGTVKIDGAAAGLRVTNNAVISGSLGLGVETPGVKLSVSTAQIGARVNVTSSSDILQLQSSGTGVFTVASNGATTIQNSSDSTGAFVVRNSAANPVFTVDTTTQRASVGTTGAAKFSVGTGQMTGLLVNQSGAFDIMNLQNNGTNVFTVGPTGNTIIKNSTDSATAFQLQNSAGITVLNQNTGAGSLSVSSPSNGEISEWTANSNSISPRQEHSAVVNNGYIYVMGGQDANPGTSLSSVQYAPINANNSVGAWTTTAALPNAVTQAAAATHNGFIYNVGGITGGANTDAVSYAKPAADGSISSWTASSVVLPAPRSGGTATVVNGYLYYIGGGSNATVYTSKLNADGSLGAWQILTSLPAARTFTTSVTANGYIYVVAGQTTGSGNTATTYYTKPSAANGTISSWTTSPNSLPVSIRLGGAAVINNYLYYVGGYTGSGSSAVYYTSLNATTGAIGTWTTNGINRAAGNSWFDKVVSSNNYLYDLGGGFANGNVMYAYQGLPTLSVTQSGVGDIVNFNGVSGNTVLKVGSTGNILIKNSVDSTNAFQIQNAAGTSLVNVDTVNGRIALGLGATATNGILTIGTDATSGLGGGIYFGSTVALYKVNNTQLGVNGQFYANNAIISGFGSFTTYGATSGNSVAATLSSGNITGGTGRSGDAAVRSGDNTSTGNTGAVVIQSGNATTGNSGNIQIDSGTAGTLAGAINIGTSNSSGVTIGRVGTVSTVAGDLTVGGILSDTYSEVGTNNLVTNGSFESGTTGWSTNQATISQVTGGFIGLNALRVNNPTAVTTGGSYAYQNIATPQTMANKSYTLTVYAKADTPGSVQAPRLIAQNGTDANVAKCTSANISLTTTWTKYQYTCSWPTTTDSTIMRVALIGFSGNSTNNAYFDGVQIQNGSTANLNVSGTLNVGTGSGVVATFSGSVQGGQAVAGNQFVTLDQANSLYAPGAGSDAYIKNGTALQMANFNIQSTDVNSVAAAIRGANGQVEDLLQLYNAAGEKAVQVTAGGTLWLNKGVTVGGGGITGVASTLNTGNAANIALVVRGVTGQTADLLQVRNAGGTVLANVTANGNLIVQNGVGFGGSNSAGVQLTVTSTLAGNKGLVIVGASGQTSDLFQLQNNAGTTLTAFDKDGKLVFGADTNLYRSAANNLKTDGNLNVVGSIIVNDTVAACSNIKLCVTTSSIGARINATGTSDILQLQNNGSNVFTVGANGAANSTVSVSAPVLQMSGNGSTTGSLRQTYLTANGGVAANQLLILTNDGAGNPRVTVTVNPRDARVIGVAGSSTAAASNQPVDVIVSGLATVNVDSGAVAIGDQLVASANGGRALVDNNATTGILGYATTTKAAGATGTVGVRVQIINGQYTPTFRNATDTTTAFQIQNAAGTSLFTVDTTNTKVGIGIAPVAGNGLLQVGAANSTTAASGITFGGQASVNLYRSADNVLRTDGGFAIGGNNSVTGTLQIQSFAGIGNGALTTGQRLTVTTAAAANKGLVVKGFTGQTANLVEVQDVDGNNLFAVDPTGSTTLAGVLNVQGTAVSIFGGSVQGADAIANNQFATYGQVVAAVNGAANGTNYIQNGTVLQTANFNIQSASVSANTATIRATTGQTADLLQFQNASGGLIAKIGATGDIFTNGVGTFGGNVSVATPQLGVRTRSASATGIVVQGSASQTADLFLAVDATGATVSSISATGQVKVAGATAYSGALNVGTNTTTAAGGIYLGTDTNLYRSAANTLQTDDSFVLNGTGSNLNVGGTLTVTGSTSLTNLTVSGDIGMSGKLYNTTAGLTAGSARVDEATTNLVTNPSFETNTAGWTMGAQTARDTSQGYVGQSSLKFDSAGSVVTANAYISNASHATAAAGDRFTHSVYLKGNVVSGTVFVRLYDCASTSLGSLAVAAGSISATEWRRFSITSPALTAGQSVCAQLTPSMNGVLYMDAIQVEKKAYATSYADGSLGSGYAWSGTAHASTSTRNGGGFVADSVTALQGLGVGGSLSVSGSTATGSLNVANSTTIAGTLNVGTGTGLVATFTGSVQGGDAVANNQFTNLGQVNTLISQASIANDSKYIKNTSTTSPGSSISLRRVDNGITLRVDSYEGQTSNLVRVRDSETLNSFDVLSNGTVRLIAGESSDEVLLGTRMFGESANMFELTASGMLRFNADIAGGTNLYQSGTNTLRTDGALSVGDTGMFAGTVQGADATANNQFATLGQVNSLVSGAVSGAAGNYVQNGTILQTANFNIQSASSANPAGVLRAASGQTSGNVFAVQGSDGTNIFNVDASGVFSMYQANGSALASFSNANSYLWSNEIMVGTASSGGARLTVQSASDTQIGAVIRANSATQTANILEVRNSANSVLLSVNNAGNFNTVGTLSVNGTARISTTGAFTAVGITNSGGYTQSGGSANSLSGTLTVGGFSTFNGGTDIVRTYSTANAGEQINGRTLTTFSVADTGLKQGQRVSTLATNTSGTINTLVGSLNLVSVNGSGGTVANAYNLWNRVDVAAGAIIQNSRNVNVEESTGAGTIQNQYGVYVAPLSKGTTSNYAIYTAGTTGSYFGGSVSVASLTTAGNITQSSTGAFSTGTGAVTLNGATTISNANPFTVGTGATTLGGTLTVAGATTVNNNLTVNGGVNVSGYRTTDTGSTLSGQYTKLGTCTITAQYNDCRTSLSIVSTSDGNATGSRAQVDFRAKQNAVLGSNPVVNVEVTNRSGNITASNFVAVTTVSAGSSVVDLYGQVSSTFQRWSFTPVLNTSNSTPPIWLSNQPFIATLPAGTQTVGTYADVSATTINGTSITISGNASFANTSVASFGSAVGDKIQLYSNTYGIGVESNNLTNWSANQFRWRIGGTSVTSGTEAMVLSSGGNLTVAGAFTATGAIKTSADIQTGGVSRLTNAGVLQNITGINNAGGYTQSGVTANTLSGVTSFTAAGTALSVTNNATVGGTLAVGTFRAGTITDGISYNDSSSANGVTGKFRLSGSARNTKKIVLTPEYAGAVLDGTGQGSMTAAYETNRRENYYKWTTTNSGWQEYSIVITMAVPSDWSAWAPLNALTVNAYNNGAVDAGAKIDITGTTGTSDVSAGNLTPSSDWSTYNFSLDSVKYTADGMMTIRITPGAQNNGVAGIGNVTLTYLSSF